MGSVASGFMKFNTRKGIEDPLGLRKRLDIVPKVVGMDRWEKKPAPQPEQDSSTSESQKTEIKPSSVDDTEEAKRRRLLAGLTQTETQTGYFSPARGV